MSERRGWKAQARATARQAGMEGDAPKVGSPNCYDAETWAKMLDEGGTKPPVPESQIGYTTRAREPKANAGIQIGMYLVAALIGRSQEPRDITSNYWPLIEPTSKAGRRGSRGKR